MNGRYLLDTNAVIALFENETRLLERLATASETFVPTIALGELYFGAAKSRQATENAARIDQFAARSSVLGCDASVAREYGRIKNRLRETGRPLPENDIWIAATARHYGLALVTRDRHFREVEGLELQIW